MEYQKDPNQDAYLKVGKLITGYVRRNRYNQNIYSKREMDCINFLITEAIPLSGSASNVTQLRKISRYNPLRVGTFSTPKVLTLFKPSPAELAVLNQLKNKPLDENMLSVLEQNSKYIKITEKLFGQIARNLTIENNKNVRADYP